MDQLTTALGTYHYVADLVNDFPVALPDQSQYQFTFTWERSFPKVTYTAQLYVMGWLWKTWQNRSTQRQRNCSNYIADVLLT